MTEKRPAYYIGDSGITSRSPRDFYETPERAVFPLLKRETFPQYIWEPACGKGSIIRAIVNKQNTTVYRSDIYDYGFPFTVVADFFEFKSPIHLAVKSIITNPPYLIKHPSLGRIAVEDWVQHADKIGIEKHAWLLKTVAVAGIRRSAVFQGCGLKTIYSFRERLDMMNGTEQKSMIDYAWFVFEKGFRGNPTLQWITQED